jgi:hypothetical protein
VWGVVESMDHSQEEGMVYSESVLIFSFYKPITQSPVNWYIHFILIISLGADKFIDYIYELLQSIFE